MNQFSRFGYRLSVGVGGMVKQNLLQVRRAGTVSTHSVWKTVTAESNTTLRYFGLTGALGLGLLISYGASRPTTYTPFQTRETMSAIGGAKFASIVRNRIMKTYGYLSAGLFLTGVTSFLLFTRGWGYRVLAMNPWVFGIGTLAATWMSLSLTQSINAETNPFAKHAAWMTTNALIGFSLVGLGTIAGAAIVQQAALITGCIVGGMSTVALVSPNDQFLRMGPYLGVGLGVVIAASLGGMFFPASTLLMNVSLYGGLGVFGLFTAHDAQRVLHDAQVVDGNFDPIGEQMGLYMDSINIFVRIVQILMMQNRKK